MELFHPTYAPGIFGAPFVASSPPDSFGRGDGMSPLELAALVGHLWVGR